MKLGKLFPRVPFNSAPDTLSSQGEIIQLSLLFHNLEHEIGGVWLMPEIPLRHLSYHPDAK
jgi:hypothetical protein